MLFFPVAGGIAATVTLFPIAGVHSLWFLTAVLPGIVFYRTFGTVGRRVESLLRELEETGGEAVEGFLVIGKTHSPGVVVLRRTELELAPLVGARHVFPLREVQLIGEGRWLPGKFVWGKRAFTFRTTLTDRSAFAVAESVGFRWSAVLASRS